MKSYLLNSVAHFEASNEQGAAAAAEAARKAAIEVERAKVVLTKVDIPDDKDEKKDDEQEKEDSAEETKNEGGENADETDDDETIEDDKEDVNEEDKEALKAKKKDERIQRKFQKEVGKRKELEAKIAALEAKIAADPEKKLTNEDVETLAEQRATQKQLVKELVNASNDLADKAQKHLKLKSKAFDSLVKEALEELNIEAVPGELVGALHDLDNGGIVLAHLLNNVDEMEDIIALRSRPTKLGMELIKLATKLATPPKKKISQVPDSIEPLGGKAVQSDRLAFLMNKKNKTQDEMSEYVLLRNADVSNKRHNGMRGLR